MDQLKEIGFFPAGYCRLIKGKLKLELDYEEDFGDFLFCLSVGDKPMLVGKSSGTLAQAFQGYLSPDGKNSDEVKVNGFMANHLEANPSDKIGIHAFIDYGLIRYGKFVVNLPVGLVDSIIKFVNPPWNHPGQTFSFSDLPGEEASTAESSQPAIGEYKSCPSKINLVNKAGDIFKPYEITRGPRPEDSFEEDINVHFNCSVSEAMLKEGTLDIPDFFSTALGPHGSTISIVLPDGSKIVQDISRHTPNGVPRIPGGPRFRDYVQAHFVSGQQVRFCIESPHRVVLS